MPDSVPAYAVAYLRNVDFGDEIIRYMREIDDTLTPFGGEFIVHGGELEAKEGQWDGTLVIIRFPADSRGWRGTNRPTINASCRCG